MWANKQTEMKYAKYKGLPDWWPRVQWSDSYLKKEIDQNTMKDNTNPKPNSLLFLQVRILFYT